MKKFKIINKELGRVEFTGTYSECLKKRTDLLKEYGAVLSRPNDYFLIESIN